MHRLSRDALHVVLEFADAATLLRSAIVAREWECETSLDSLWEPIAAARWRGKTLGAQRAHRDYSACVRALSVRELKTALKERGQTARARRCVEKCELRELLLSTRAPWLNDTSRRPLSTLPVRPCAGKAKNAYAYAELDARRENLHRDDLTRYTWNMFFKSMLAQGADAVDDPQQRAFYVRFQGGVPTKFIENGMVESAILQQRDAASMGWRIAQTWTDGRFGTQERRHLDCDGHTLNMLCVGP